MMTVPKVVSNTSGKASLFVAIAAVVALQLLRNAAFGELYAPPEIEHWMDDWMAPTKQPFGSLHISRFKDPIYFLTRPISWKPDAGQEQFGEVTAPKGFVTDFASIPRPFWSLLRPDGDYTFPAIIHDFLYWTQDRPRDHADTIFKLTMQDFRITAATIAIIYNAVRIGGGSSWNENASLKASGEKRILVKFPEDPRITWDEWKKVPGVFGNQ